MRDKLLHSSLKLKLWSVFMCSWMNMVKTVVDMFPKSYDVEKEFFHTNAFE